MLCRREGRGEEEGARTGYRGGRALHALETVSPGQLDFDAISQKCSDRALGQDGVGGACPLGTPWGPPLLVPQESHPTRIQTGVEGSFS